VTLVRAGSAWHREPLVPVGHQRSPPASENRRSQSAHRLNLGQRSSMDWVRTPRSPRPQPRRSAFGWSVGRENRAGGRHLAVDEP
jgi:hypothetical protein